MSLKSFSSVRTDHIIKINETKKKHVFLYIKFNLKKFSPLTIRLICIVINIPMRNYIILLMVKIYNNL